MVHPLAGRKQSPEHVAKRVAALREKGVYARFGEITAERNVARTGWRHTDETKAKQSASHIGLSTTWLRGRKQSVEARRNLAAYWAANPEKHNHYKDGKGEERHGERRAAMQRIDYRLWREAVFTRDDYTCQGEDCGVRGGRLHADHIKPWSTHPELRYEVTNGRTLCVDCHRKTPTWGTGALKALEEAA